jgi:hypothetical protein
MEKIVVPALSPFPPAPPLLPLPAAADGYAISFAISAIANVVDHLMNLKVANSNRKSRKSRSFLNLGSNYVTASVHTILRKQELQKFLILSSLTGSHPDMLQLSLAAQIHLWLLYEGVTPKGCQEEELHLWFADFDFQPYTESSLVAM